MLNSPGAKAPISLEEAQEVKEEMIPHPLSPDAPGVSLRANIYFASLYLFYRLFDQNMLKFIIIFG